jgi:hypothetical protein
VGRYVSSEKYLSVSMTRVIRQQDQEAKKVGSLKYFVVYDVEEKEPRVNRLTYPSLYQSDWHGHLPEAEEEISKHSPIRSSK